MKIKTSSFVAVATVLLMLALVFVAPVMAGDSHVASAENYVAKIGDNYYLSLTEAINEADDNAVIYLNATVIEEPISPWTGSENSNHNCEKNITIYGVNHDKTIDQWDENYLTVMTGGMYLGYDDMNTRDHTIVVKGIVFYGNGLTVAAQKDVTIENNLFVNINSGSPAVIVMDSANNKKKVQGSVTIKNNYIENVSTNDVGIEVRRPYTANIEGNYVNGTGQNSILVSANNDSDLSGYGINGVITITNNLLENWGQVADSNGLKDGYAIRINFADGSGTASVIENVMVNDDSSEAFVKITNTNTNPDVSNNYWNGNVPTGTFGSDVPYYILNDAVTDPAKIGTYYIYDDESDKYLLVDFAVAKIGNEKYYSLEKAVAEADNGDTVTLLKDAEGAGIKISEGLGVITIDFGGKTYTVTEPAVGSTGTETLGLQLLPSNTITLKNGGITSNDQDIVKMLINNYANLTLDDIILDGTKLGDGRYTLSNNNGNVVITGNTQIIAPNNGVAFDVCYYASYPSVSVTFDEKFTGTVTGNIEHTNHKNAEISNYQDNAKLIIKAGTFNGAFSTVDEGANIVIYGGTFSSNPSAYIASGYEVVQPGDKYLVQKYVDRSSSSSSSSSTTEPEEPVDPEQPEEPVVEPETPVDEPEAGEATVETEVTDGGEVELETPTEEPAVDEGGAVVADDDAKITAVVLPTGTDSEVTFVPVSEQPAPAGQEENTKKVFEINVPTYEKGKPATIKFTMTVAELEADGKTAGEVALWHFDEETGEWTKLLTSYTIVDGIVYFEAITYDFSPFAIIYEETPVDEPVEEPETPATPAPVLGVLAALGAAVVLRRK